jgi:GPH family glycoside/pentoside/hexuronide:cation symporter
MVSETIGVADTASAAGAVQPSAANRLSTLMSLGFGVGTVGVSALLNSVSIYLPALMATVLGQSTALAGMLITGSKIYDMGADLAIGAISDRAKTRMGRRRPFMLAGAILSTLVLPFIFAPIGAGGPWMIPILAVTLILYSTGYSLFNVPYLAMPGEMTDSYTERTRLLSFRTLFVSVGQLLSIAGSAEILKLVGGGARGYAILGLTLAAIVLVSQSLTVIATARAKRVERHEGPKVGLRTQIDLVLGNRPLLLLMGTKFCQLLALSTIVTTQLLFILNVLKAGYGGQLQLGLASNIAIAVSMPAWVRIARRLGKRRTYIAATLIYSMVTLSWLAASAAEPSAMLVLRGAIGGIGSGGMLLMGTSMLPDVMEYDRRRTGLRREGMFSSFYAIVEKFAYAIGPAIIGLYLTAAGYISTSRGKLVDQPHAAITALYAGVAVIPVVLALISVGLLLLYDLDEAKLKATALAPR